jgi:hypothetical protein
MKVEIEIEDEKMQIIEKYFEVDAKKLIENVVKTVIDMAFQAVILAKSGVRIDLSKVQAEGFKLGGEVFREALKERRGLKGRLKHDEKEERA